MLNYTIGAVRKSKKKKAAASPSCSRAGKNLKKRGTSASGRALRLCNPVVQKSGHTVKRTKKKKK